MHIEVCKETGSKMLYPEESWNRTRSEQICGYLSQHSVFLEAERKAVRNIEQQELREDRFALLHRTNPYTESLTWLFHLVGCFATAKVLLAWARVLIAFIYTHFHLWSYQYILHPSRVQPFPCMSKIHVLNQSCVELFSFICLKSSQKNPFSMFPSL